ncbi:RNB domain-containing ribonuclease [bacterium]|nr:RNB domain-containing ribonuclease [bacterium]
MQSNEHHKKIEIARKLLLQSMSKAIYSEKLADHFGIASKNYTHFTSPIRRFPDTLVSELLHMFIFEPDEYTDDERERIKAKIIDYAKRASDLERLATDLGFDVNEMKFAEYMTQFLGKHFIATITSVNKFGTFVQLDNTIEGLIHITNMVNDFYNYDEETSTLIGRNTRTELHVGDKVEVEVIGADKHTKKIDFKLIAKLPDEE